MFLVKFSLPIFLTLTKIHFPLPFPAVRRHFTTRPTITEKEPAHVPFSGVALARPHHRQDHPAEQTDLRSATELIGSGTAIQRARQSSKRDVSCGLSSGALLGLGGA